MSRGLLLRGARRTGADHPGPVLLVDGTVAAIGAAAEGAADVRAVDLDGLLLAPGFIDLQVNGAAGRDFTADPAAMHAVGRELARHGVTAFLATIVSSSPATVRAALDAWADRDSRPGAVPIGLHLEGPFLAPGRRGAHDAAELRLPDPAEASDWAPARGVRLVTLAPELPGAVELVRALAGRGVLVGVGHSDADAAAARAAFAAGARYVTHTFNAMSGLDHRRPGVVAAALLDERPTLGLIADGHHLAPEALQLAWRLAGPVRCSLVSDAIAALDMPPGRYQLGGLEVIVGDGVARLADGTLAGAVAPLDACVRRFAAATGCGLEAAIAAVTSVPAALLALDDGRGTVRAGGRADLAILGGDGTVAATIVGGEVAYAEDPERWA